MEKELETILSKIADIVQQDKKQKECGEAEFNIFELLNLNTDERKHSAFIAELLNPSGSHGYGDVFLKKLINKVDCLRDWEFNTRNAKVLTELSLGLINNKCTDGGIIDIWIESCGQAIIFENKIYAPDQRKQLLRYRNYAEKLVKAGKLSSYRIIYLTLDSSEASDFSTNSQLQADIDYFTISYASEIIDWLISCEVETLSNVHINSIIKQYINIIKQLTHQDMLSQNSDKIVDIMARAENVAAVLTIANLIEKWRTIVVEKYLIPQLHNWAKDNNLRFEIDGKFDNLADCFGFSFYRVEWSRSAIWIYSECSATRRKDRCRGYFYIDISSTDKKTLKGLCKRQTRLFEQQGNINQPYGWEYLDKYRDWTNEIMIDIVEGKVADYICKKVQKVLEIIDEHGIDMP